jgi:hypothetical protein
MRVFRDLSIVLLAAGCVGCDPISKTQVSIDSPTAMGMDCALRALGEGGVDTKDSEGQDMAVRAGETYMGLHARQDGYDIYVSKVGKPHSCVEIERFAPYMRRAVNAISAQCSGSTSPKITAMLANTGCGIRVDG